jgi:transcriptional regulator with XRE-family HTH domain
MMGGNTRPGETWNGDHSWPAGLLLVLIIGFCWSGGAGVYPMAGLGSRLLTIRKERGLSLREVEKLVEDLVPTTGNAFVKVSASWLGRIEHGGHKISAEMLRSLEEVYRVAHDELIEGEVSEGEVSALVESAFDSIPASARAWLAAHQGPLLPPRSWGAHFEKTTLLPLLSQYQANGSQSGRRTGRGRGTLWGVIGTTDKTLFPFVRPGSVVEIDPGSRSISSGQTFPSIHERPIYFLRHRNGYACGWCDLDPTTALLTLVPSAVTPISMQRWRYKEEVEVIGMLIQVCTWVGPLDHGK